MSKLAFLLGRKPLISLAELAAVLPTNTNYLELNGEVLIVDTEVNLTQEEARLFLNRLGGSIKIIEITAQADKNPGKIPQQLAQLALEKFKGQEGKAKYALFVKSIKNKAEQILKNSLLETKKTLKAAEISSRFINNNFQNTEIAALKGENILNRGAEFCALEGNSGWFLGHTLAIQDIDAYSARDYDRPERDARVGMLPPKLAQIMINLTGQTRLEHQQTSSEKYLYDPFCGLGTVLMEGLLMGFHVVGSDLAPDILKKAHKNLEWYADKIKVQNKSRLFVKDATKLTVQDIPEPIAAVVSETYLGPPMTHLPDPNQMQEIFSDLEYTLSQMFKNLHEILPSGASVVITLLTYRQNQGYGNTTYHTLDGLLKKLPSLGFVLADVLPANLIAKFSLPANVQKTLLYERPDQTVCRGIYKFQRA